MAGSPNLPAPSVEPPVDGSANDECPFPIVAIGASAGGLDAYRRLLQALPADTGMAYVLIQHLHPDFPSQLAEILQRSTAMKVIEVQDEPVVEADTVYVIPPGRSMVMDRNRLQLHPRSAIRRLHRPVDAFFSSLAEFHGNCGVGVLLSGTGSDGVEGMEELKSEGGITFAQDDSAQYDGMPKAAQTAGCVDFVLSPEGIAEELVRISKHPYVMTRQQARHQQGDDAVARILRLVHEVTGVDFGNYKSTTLQRRLTRRMLLQGVDSPEQYLRKLRGNLSEVHELYRDFLINVTRFFRDPESFDALATAAFPNLFRGRHADAPVRVWTLGCATGEEAYSLAIGLHEYVEREKLSVPIQVFATDLSDRGIEWARTGLYSREIENHVSPERLKRYFDRTDGGYRIGKLIRESCVFARQNVLNDPPFSRMDLISCRNLLIYLEPVLQQRVLPLVHYALNPGGFLWLGSAETIGNFDNLFEVLDSRHRIYRARSGAGQGSLPLASMRTPISYRGPPAVRPTEPIVPRDPARDADRLLLARYVPAAVLVNGDAEALQFRGDTGPYLLLGGGKPSLNLYKMARDGLLVPLRESIQRARQDAMPVSCGATVTDAEGSLSAVQIDVLPVQGETANDPHFLVVFRRQAGAEPRPPGQVASPAGAVGEPGGDEHLRLENVRLVQELNATRDYLHALLEQRDAANEELQSANEEAQSANEELQSINEELQTTKEEMESANEELLSVNEELTNRHEQLAKASDDLVNIVASTQMALVSVDRDLRIRRFTPAAQDLFSLISTDIGRPLGNLRLSFATEDLESVLYQAMCGVAVPDRDVRDRSGRWHSLRIRPFRKSGGEIDGAVLVLVDIDQQKRSEASLRDSQRKFSLLMEGGTGIAIIMLDPDGKITGWNSGAERLFQYTEAQVLGQPASMLYPPDRHDAVYRDIRDAFDQGSALEDNPMRRRDGSQLWATGVVTVLRDEAGEVCGYSKVITDVTGKHRIEQERRVAEQRKDEFLSILAHELRNPLAPIRSSLYLLDDPRLAPEQAAHAREVMKRQVAHMVRLIDDLLDVARIAKGKIEFRPEPLELSTVVETAVQSAQPLISRASQELSIQLPPTPVLLYADHARLAQAISNLLLNSTRYTQDGGHIRLSVSVEDGECRISVADDGIGIAPDRQAEVFELFAQVGHVPGRSRDGLGIGLTMVRMLAEMHSGWVEVQSAGEGSGSVFTLVLPHHGRDRQAPPEVAPEAPLAPGHSILVMDDNRDAADSLASLLRSAGHRVEACYDGEAALKLAAELRPDIGLLDLGLPGIDGLEVCRRLRQSAAGKDMLLVALTGWGQECDKHNSHAAGFDGHLTKPVDPERIGFELERMRRAKAGG